MRSPQFMYVSNGQETKGLKLELEKLDQREFRLEKGKHTGRKYTRGLGKGATRQTRTRQSEFEEKINRFQKEESRTYVQLFVGRS